MKSKQTFIKFYSNFIILINQLKKYSEKIKINDFEHKIIFSLRRVIVNLNDFTFLKTLKRKCYSSMLNSITLTMMSKTTLISSKHSSKRRSKSSQTNSSTSNSFVRFLISKKKHSFESLLANKSKTTTIRIVSNAKITIIAETNVILISKHSFE